jgi:hypothetical protein
VNVDPSHDDPSLSLLLRRLDELPSALVESDAVRLPRSLGPTTTTGIGGSEAPARLLAETLLSRGVPARFLPLSVFALDPPSGESLVVFSQGLSPNARLSIAAAPRFSSRYVMTSVAPSGGNALDAFLEAGFTPVLVPPREERGLLVRVVGPVVAALVALRWGGVEITGAEAAEAYRRGRARHGAVIEPSAMVLAGVSTEGAHLFRWRVLETLLIGDLPTWDVLQIAHGPLQAFHDGDFALLAFEHARSAMLVDRLAAALSPERHRMQRLRAEAPSAACALFELVGALDACLLATLRVRPRELRLSRFAGIDAPLYGLDRSADLGRLPVV